MSASPSVETVTPAAEKAKLAAVGVLVVAAVAAFYLLASQPLWQRVVALLLLLAGAVALFFRADPGRRLIGFGRDATRELRKVVWPSRKEATQMTLYVFAFVVVMALFLWLTDKALEWVFYDLILGWRG
ncbi:preprotein translocase subunit SecE [Piscinibacter sp. Jin2]|uniref:Protein translocase subunit SecE n=1 Tax=Aquariibacter lacus TaxID=2801332 RepID=A0A9X0XFB9_9BURK|nr:preprotein translocase subunit SecE [Piscinibacter lacus]MBL0718445.1 preprotein translocase subunit SecE [Piscinibacter lacus]